MSKAEPLIEARKGLWDWTSIGGSLRPARGTSNFDITLGDPALAGAKPVTS